MNEEFVILFPPTNEAALEPFTRVSSRARWCRTAEEVADVYAQQSVRLCLAFDSAELVRTVANMNRSRRLPRHKLLLLETLDERDAAFYARLRVLRTLFAEVVHSEPSLNLLKPEELVEALSAPNASALAIAASYDPAASAIYILRGNLEMLIIPADALTSYGDGAKPDLSRLRVEDCGLTLAAGDYEASMDALLYEYDPVYRRELKKQRREEEQSLGASIRRLRLQKGLRQSDFPEVSMKEVARIESGQVSSPRTSTLKHIAERLSVSVDELGDY